MACILQGGAEPDRFASGCAARSGETDGRSAAIDANSSPTGQHYRGRLRDAGIEYHDHCAVTAITKMQAFELSTPLGTIRAKRLLLAAGAWLKPLAALLAMDLPVNARANIVSVTERMPPLTSSVIGHATGLLTTKQKANGTVLIGGGWQGRGTPKTGRGEVDAASVRPNPALAHYTVPALGAAHVLRSWTGFEANVPDFYPLAGALPGVPEAYVLGCVRDGDTIGPYIGQLMGDFILGREPEMPLFDPVRDVLFARSGQDHVSAKIWVHH